MVKKTELEHLSDIAQKLDTLIGICASQGKPKEDQIKVLVSLGFTNTQISQMIGIPKGTVDVIRAKMKKR